jgi:hypothetical protein
MTYRRVIIVDHDPSVRSLVNIQGLNHKMILEADLVVVRRLFAVNKTGLSVSVMIAEKDRYANNNRILTREELFTITTRCDSIITVDQEGVASENEKE